MQITFLSPWHPYPPDNGAKQRALALIHALAREHTVDLIVLTPTTSTENDSAPLTGICRSVTTMTARLFTPSGTVSRMALLSVTPRSISTTDNPAITALLNERIESGKCDAVFCYCAGDLRPAWYGAKVSKRIPVVIDDPEPSRYFDAFRHAPTALQSSRAALTWWKYRRFVRTLLHTSAGCFVTSEREAILLRDIAPYPDRVFIVPNGVTLTKQTEHAGSDPNRIVYSGAPTYAPNLDAVRFFVADILPCIRARLPDAWLAVTGKADGVELDDLVATPGVTFTGWLPDIRAFVAGSRVCVVPLRQGGGTRLKILEAMAVGTPVIATTKGAEGLAVTHGEDILIADNVKEFADATVRLLTDDVLHERIATYARATVAARYDWDTIGAEMLDAFARLTGTRETPAGVAAAPVGT